VELNKLQKAKNRKVWKKLPFIRANEFGERNADLNIR
jgi:hypothetical protein